MIKAILLIFDPVGTWDDISQSRRRTGHVLLVYLLPLLVLTSAFEGYGLVHWGKWQGEITPRLRHFSVGEAVIFGVAQILLSLFVVFVSSSFVRSLGSTFHGRHTYNQAFGTVAYGLCPVFLFRLLDAFSGVSPWISWGLGILFSMALLYHGVPKMMEPDPAHAFGLFFMTALLLLFMTGLARLLGAFYLQGKFPQCEQFVSHLAARLPF